MSVTTPIGKGEQLIVIGQTDPAVTCNFELRDVDRERIARWPAVADQTGDVFWLVTIPADMMPGSATVVAACGGERDRVSLEVLSSSSVPSVPDTEGA